MNSTLDARTIRHRAVALTFGLATHSLFFLAVGLMGWSLWGGMGLGRTALHGGWAALLDALLLLQFPLLHSFFLGRGARALARIAPLGLGRDLTTTIFAGFASAQLVATFALWAPSHVMLWQPPVAWLAGWRFVYAASWLLLLKAMFDAGLGVQTGYLGWTAVVRGRRVKYPSFSEHGLFRLCRQPVYLAFAAVLWSGPVWTLDHLVIAVVWSSYCFLGPRWKERRYLARHGEAFASYQQRVPYWWPRRPRAAA